MLIQNTSIIVNSLLIFKLILFMLSVFLMVALHLSFHFLGSHLHSFFPKNGFCCENKSKLY